MHNYTSTILITGGTSGLGYQAALVIAKAQPNTEIVIASRTDKDKAADTINAELQQSNVVFKSLDLSDLSNVRQFAAEWKQQGYAPINALLLNAGLQFPAPGPYYSKDGIEMTFAVNHIGHALLFHLLRQELTPKCRIVVTSSGTHDPAQKTLVPDAKYTSAELLAHPQDEYLKINGIQRYSTSKLCNVLWTYALDRHITELKGSDRSVQWTVVAIDPGLMLETSLSREHPSILQWLARTVFARMHWLLKMLIGPNVRTAAESGDALARLAIANDVEGVSAKYYEGLKQIPSSDASYDREKQDDLWEGTLQMIAKDEEERQKFASLL